ncbi:hypothetical protein WA171_004173 [Blastocystis sp. BT1]
MIQSYLSLVVILSVVSATYLQTVTLSTTSDFSSFLCGAYRTDCEQSAIEEHIYKGTKGEYPTEFIKVFYHYSSESCGDDLAFTTQSTGSISDPTAMGNDTLSLKIAYSSATVTFSKQPADFGAECSGSIVIGDSYDISSLTCTVNGSSLFSSVPTVDTSETVTLLFESTFIRYSTGEELKAYNRDSYCAASEDDDNLTVMFIVLAVVMVLLVVIACLLICCCVKDTKKGDTKKKDDPKKEANSKSQTDAQKQPEPAKKADLEKQELPIVKPESYV